MASSKDKVRWRPGKAEKYLVAFLEDYLVEQLRQLLKSDVTARRELYAAVLDAFDDEVAFQRGMTVHDKMRHHLPHHAERARVLPSHPYWLLQKYLAGHLEEHGRSLKFVIRDVMKCRTEHAYALSDQEAGKLTSVLFPTMSDWSITASDGSRNTANPWLAQSLLQINWDRLSAREQRVIRLLNGIDGIDIGRERTALEVATILSLTEREVHELQERAQKKLRKGFAPSLPGDTLED